MLGPPPPPPRSLAKKVAILSADGATMTSSVTVVRSGGYGDTSAAFVGDGFLVASRGSSGIQIGRVELDATFAARAPVVLDGEL